MAHESSQDRAHDLYKRMAHDSSLKGLLKPFKGKGDYTELELHARGVLAKLDQMMVQLVKLTDSQHIAHKNIVLRLHKAKSGQGYLRWRTLKHSGNQAMGFQLWQQVVQDPLTGPQTKQNLLILEQQRNALNMQASTVQYIVRQAIDCAKKSELAQNALNQLNGTQ